MLTVTLAYVSVSGASLRSMRGSITLPGRRGPIALRRQLQRTRLHLVGELRGLAMSSTRRQSFAFWPRTPSVVVQKMSARSWRTWRLSVTRVSPPVPGSTPGSGTSGSDTADERSSTSRISSQASASS